MFYWRTVLQMLKKPLFSFRVRIFLLGMLCGVGIFYLSFSIASTWQSTQGYYIEEEIDANFKRVGVQSFEEVTPDDFKEFWDVWHIIESSFIPDPHTFDTAEDELPDDQKTRVPNKDEFIQGAINGLTWATKDVYTNFFDPTKADEFTEEIVEGEIDGIGAYIGMRDQRLIVIRPLPDSPAARAGLKTGDEILKIDGSSVSHYNLFSATERIRGQRGTEVVLTVFRNVLDEELDITIVRDRVEVPSVETEIRNGVFVISVFNFSQKTLVKFQDAILGFVDEANSGGADRILLDLRGNSGGILTVAVTMAGFFLPEDSIVLYEYTGSEVLKSYKTKGSIFKDELPKMTVLLDGASASASEILAAALRHHGVADIVGLQSFGKGSVQSLVDLTNSQSILKLTVAHWLTPDKQSITNNGVEPDVDYKEDFRSLLKESPDAEIGEYLLERATKHLAEK